MVDFDNELASDCSLCSISGLLFPDAWIVWPSAYKSARQWFRWRGRSLVNNKNSVCPRIEPWGTHNNSLRIRTPHHRSL